MAQTSFLRLMLIVSVSVSILFIYFCTHIDEYSYSKTIISPLPFPSLTASHSTATRKDSPHALSLISNHTISYDPSLSPPPPPNTVLQYHLVPPSHESLLPPSSLPYPRPPSYYSVSLGNGIVPEFVYLHPSPSRIWLSVYSVHYIKEQGEFHIGAMVHCVPNYVKQRNNDPNSNLTNINALSRCRINNIGVLEIATQLRTRAVADEAMMVGAGLVCEYEEKGKVTERVRVKQTILDGRSPVRYICPYPGYPSSLPSNNTIITLKYYSPSLPPSDVSLDESFAHLTPYNRSHLIDKMRFADLKRWINIRHSLSLSSLLLLPLQFSLSLPLLSTYDPLYNVVYCSAPLHSLSYVPHLREFIEHHLFVGIEHFVFYDRSGDYREILEAYREQQLITYIHSPIDPQWGFKMHFDQVYLLADCRARHYYSAKWIAIHDIDEWIIFPDKEPNKYFPSTCLQTIHNNKKKNKKELLNNITNPITLVPRFYLNFNNTLNTITSSLSSFPLILSPSPSPSSSHSDDSIAVAVDIDHYVSTTYTACRSMLMDFFLNHTERGYPFTRFISVHTGIAQHRSPEFFQYLNSKIIEQQEQQKQHMEMTEEEEEEIIHSLYFPLSLTFNWIERKSTPKSFFLSKSTCGVELHFPHSCFIKEGKGKWPDFHQWALDVYKVPVIPPTEIIFIHFKNMISHGQTETISARFKNKHLDRFDDKGAELWRNRADPLNDKNNISKTIDILNIRSGQQGQYLGLKDSIRGLWGEGIGFTSSAMRIYTLLQQMYKDQTDTEHININMNTLAIEQED